LFVIADDQLGEGDAEMAMGRMIPLLAEMETFVQRCTDVLKNCLRQLAALYRPPVPTVDVGNVHLVVGDFFVVLFCLREVDTFLLLPVL
jgi:WASH complex subunit 7